MATEPVTLLLDSDIIAFKFAAASQKNFDWEDDGNIVSHVEPFEEVAPLVDDYIAELKEDLEATDVIVCLSCPTPENFRLGVLPSYKGNRDYANRPTHLSPLKRYMAEHYRTYERPTLEADDIMGILSTHPKLVPGKRIIVSEDKDMQTIPGWLFNPRRHTKPRLITEQQADYWHLFQTLVGDATDNYKGCPGVGPVKADALLHAPNGDLLSPWSAWQAVVAAYEAAVDRKTKEPLGLTEEDALVQARVARICRAQDYDFKNKEVILWKP